MFGIQCGLNSVSRAVRVMEKALYSSYTPALGALGYEPGEIDDNGDVGMLIKVAHSR